MRGCGKFAVRVSTGVQGGRAPSACGIRPRSSHVGLVRAYPIQVGRGWSSVVKDLRDDTPLRRDCLVLTGSSSRELRDATKNFAGRRGPATTRSDRLLMPIPFRDFCRLLGGLDGLPDVPAIDPREMMGRQAREAVEEFSFWANDLVDAWELYLRCGGFPRAVADFLRTGDVTPAFLQDLWDVVRGDAGRSSIGRATRCLVRCVRES